MCLCVLSYGFVCSLQVDSGACKDTCFEVYIQLVAIALRCVCACVGVLCVFCSFCDVLKVLC